MERSPSDRTNNHHHQQHRRGRDSAATNYDQLQMDLSDEEVILIQNSIPIFTLFYK